MFEIIGCEVLEIHINRPYNSYRNSYFISVKWMQVASVGSYAVCYFFVESQVVVKQISLTLSINGIR